MSRLRRLPQIAGRRISTQFHRIPQQVRLLLVTAIFTVLTAFFASHYPLTILPEYQAGDIASADIVLPATLIVEDELRASGPPPRIKRNPVLLHAGETVTADKLSMIDAVRRYQQEQRSPTRLLGLMALVGMIFFALFKAATTTQSSRLGPRTAFWVAGTALMFQTLLVRAGMFGAAVLSTRPETAMVGDFFECQFAIPFAACALALGLLVGGQVAIVTSVMSALLAGFISPHGLSMAASDIRRNLGAINLQLPHQSA